MGTRQLSQLRLDAWLHLDNRSDFDPGTATGLARLNLVVNRAYRHVCLPNVFRHRELETSGNVVLVTATRTYALPASPAVAAVLHVHHQRQNRYLEPRAVWQILDLHNEDTSTGVLTEGIPTLYALYGTNIIVDVAANSTVNGQNLVLYYIRKPTDLTGDTNVTLLGDEWDYIIPVGAAYFGYQLLNQIERTDFWREQFGMLVAEQADRRRLEMVEPEGLSFEVQVGDYMEGSS